MNRGAAVAVVLAVIGLAWLAMYVGWRRRAGRQADVPAPAPVPEALAERAVADGVESTYVSTTAAADWLDRVVQHGLGVRSDALVLASDEGVSVLRAGAPDLFVPRADLRAVRRERMRAGKAVSGAGLLVWDWQLGDRLVSTAVKPRRDAERDDLERRITAIIEAHPQEAK